MSENQVNGRVVRDVAANGQIDPIRRGRKARTKLSVALDDIDLVGRTNTTLEQEARSAENAGREYDATLGREDIDSLIRAYAGDGCSAAHDISRRSVDYKLEVTASLRRAEVGRNRATTLAIDEREGRVPVRVILLVRVVVECDVGVTSFVKELCRDDCRLLEVTFSIRGGMIRAREARSYFTGVRLMVCPR
jgi:hypothetical protein